MGRFVNPDNSAFQKAVNSEIYVDKTGFLSYTEYSCAMKSHFRKFGNQMSGSGNHLCNYASLLA